MGPTTTKFYIAMRSRCNPHSPVGSLRGCHRAKNIKNQAVVNEDADQRTLLRKYERELRKLRAELTRRNKELVDKRHLLEVSLSVSYRGLRPLAFVEVHATA